MKPLKKVAVIINPAAGKDYPILAELNRVMKQADITWEVFITKSKKDARLLTQQALDWQPEAIAVCGGDGTVVDVASELFQVNVPLAILPGGTANILAKELGVPIELTEAVKLFLRAPKLKEMDVALVNDQPLFLRIEIGVVADMIQRTSRAQKDQLGILGYPLSALESLRQTPTKRYKLSVDGKKISTSGLGMMIANCGNVGLAGISLHKDVSCFDGKLDVFVLKKADLATLLKIGSSALVGTPKPLELAHWQGQELLVDFEAEHPANQDDHRLDTNQLTIKLSPHRLKVLL